MVMAIQSVKEKVSCPYCGYPSRKVHSTYIREIQDIPFLGKQTIPLLSTRKMFCDNPKCSFKTFSERFNFVTPKGKKTDRLIEKILITSTKSSSVSAASLLKTGSVKVCKISICELLKKMPTIVDKSSVIRVCVDDFAFQKRYTYGSVMVDLDTHRIIDIIDFPETNTVEEWLKFYPHLEVISRDGAQTYSSAVQNPTHMQYRLVTDSSFADIYLLTTRWILFLGYYLYFHIVE